MAQGSGITIAARVVGTERTEKELRGLAAAVEARAKRVTERFCLDMSARVKARKLTGQVLNVQTGRLRRSIHHEVRSDGTRVTGTVGTNVEYARIHEFGGIAERAEHNRLVAMAFGKPLKAPVWQTVRAHQARFPTRSFLRSTLGEMQGQYFAALRKMLDGVG